MRRAFLAAMALLAAGQMASGQQQANDAIARFKACLQRDGAARPECIDALSRQLSGISPSAAVPPSGGNWIVSETMSPLDYSAQITATILAEVPGKDAPSLFSIRCRGQRTELLVSTSGTWRPSRAGQFKVIHRIDDQPAVEGRWMALASGRTAAFSGDAVRLLRSLPEGGRLSISVFDWQGPAHEGTFHILGVDGVREKIAAACKW
jgi:hypothetical protein